MTATGGNFLLTSFGQLSSSGMPEETFLSLHVGVRFSAKCQEIESDLLVLCYKVATVSIHLLCMHQGELVSH